MQWDLTYLYESLDEWKKDYARMETLVEKMPAYEGTLHEFENFKAYYQLQREASLTLNKLYQYTSLKSDLNTKDTTNAARKQTMATLINNFQKATAFEKPEVLSLGWETVESFTQRDDTLKAYHFPLKKLFHQSEHVLDTNSERLLANYAQLASQGSQLHGALSTADNTTKELTLKDGSTITVSSGNFRSHLGDLSDPDDRENVFKLIFSHYEDHKYSFAQIYNTVLQADVAKMKSRGYNSSLETFLHKNAIDPVVYYNLVDVAKESTDLLKRYYAIRKEALGLEQHRTFDRFMPLAEGSSKFSYDQAKTMFFQAIDHLDEDFKAKAHDALKEGFVDVQEKDGKRTGAYSSSSLNNHPYILLNYNETLGDVFTVAHEAGHSMHSLFSAEHQEEPTQNYTIFVAEIASTFNEHLLLDHFIANNQGSKEDKIQILQQSIDDIAATFFRQTLFAAYELKAHELVEAGTPITHDTLSDIMRELYLEFYDIDIYDEPGKAYVWAYIPHMFFAPFYVYQYATSFAASLKLYDMVKYDPANINNHMTLLKSGGDDFPMNQVERAGLDLRDKDVFRSVTTRLERLLDELELALKE